VYIFVGPHKPHCTHAVTGPMASLGLASPGAAIDGVTPFFPQIVTTFFAHHCHFHWFHSGATPHLFFTFPTSFVHSVLSKLSHNFFWFGCHPLEGVNRSSPPPSDATVLVSLYFKLGLPKPIVATKAVYF